MGNEDNGAGFILLYRSILLWEWWWDNNTLRLFLYLLLTANFKDRRIEGKVIRRGQVLTSIKKLSAENRLTERQTRTALSHLEATGEVTSKKSPQGTVITIKNYNAYQKMTSQTTNDRQAIDTESDKQNAKRPTNDRQTTDTPHLNKEKRKRNIPPISPRGEVGVFELYAGGDAALLNALLAFEQMRSKIKRPMTDVAKKRLTQKLDKLAHDYPGMDKTDVLEEAVLHCWQSVYPPKEKKQEEDDNDVL